MRSSDTGNQPENSVQLIRSLKQKLLDERSIAAPDHKGQNKIHEVLVWADRHKLLVPLGIFGKDRASSLFSRWRDERTIPPEMMNETTFRESLQKIARDTFDEKSPIRSDEAESVKELIETGELFNDLAYTVTTLFNLVPKPENSKNPLGTIVNSLTDFPKAVAADIDPEQLSSRFVNQLQRLKQGDPLDEPQILDHTLKQLYAISPIAPVIGTSNALLAEENQTLRIALLVYARLNGVNLEEQDIDKVRETILNTDQPRLGGLLKYALENAARLKG